MKPSVEQLELAIDQYMNTGKLNVFSPFAGQCKGLEPYGEQALGDAINEGDLNEIASLIHKMSSFSEELLPEENATALDLIKKEELEKTEKEQKAANDTESRRKVYQKVVDTAKQHNGVMGIGGSKKAKADIDIYEAKLDNLGKEKSNKADDDYLKAKSDAITKLNSSEQRGNIMNISKRDLTKIMSAMKAINKHFAEEEAEDQVEEVPATETEVEEEVSTMIEIPSEKIDELIENITESLETAKTIVEADDEEDVDDDVEEDEDAETEEFCGDSDEDKEFMDFAEQVTETIEKLSESIEDISKAVNTKSEEYVENMSTKEFRQFAESVVTTIENLKARIDACTNAVNKNAITTNLDSLKNDKSDMFVSNVEDSAKLAEASVVQNTEASVLSNAKTFSESDSNARYAKVKDFLKNSL